MPAIPPEFIVQYQGKDYITAAGLTYLGHLQGLKRVDVQLVQAPTKDSLITIVRCEVETDLGVFSDYGEVSSGNRNAVAKEYPVSMASTRARNRALRIATKCPLSSYEEMGIGDDADIPRGGQNRQPTPAQPDKPVKRELADDAPCSARGVAVLAGLAEKLRGMTGDVVAVPDGLTNAEARELHLLISDALTAAEQQAVTDATELAEVL